MNGDSTWRLQELWLAARVFTYMFLMLVGFIENEDKDFQSSNNIQAVTLQTFCSLLSNMIYSVIIVLLHVLYFPPDFDLGVE